MFPFPVELVWTTQLDAAPAAPAGYDERHVYVPVRTEPARLVALGLGLGDVRWTADVATAVAPAACAGHVLIVTDEALESREASSGEARWRVPVAGKIALPATCGLDVAVVATATGDIVGVQIADGIALWQQRLGSPLHVAPVVGGARVYLGLDDQRVVALDTRTGAKAWEHRLGGAPTGMLVTSDRLYVGSVDNYFYSFNSIDGELDWQIQTGADLVGAAVGDIDNVYFVSRDNVLRAVNRRSGNLRWKAQLDTRSAVGPVHLGNAVLVIGVSPELRAHRALDGVRVGEFGIRARVVGVPYFAVGIAPMPRLIVLTADGLIEAVTSIIDPPIGVLDKLPGAALIAEQLAVEPDLRPFDFLPGRTLAPESEPIRF